MNYWRKDIAAWRTATASLSYAEKGAYDDLLGVYYANEKPLPNDERAIFRLVGAQDRKEQDIIRRVLREFFHENGGELHNDRADLELKSYAVYCENQRRRRLGIKKADSEARIPASERIAPKPEPLTLPAWLNADTWRAWVKIRPSRARTADAQRAALAKLEQMRSEGVDPNLVIETSLANGWQGLFKPDEKNSGSLREHNRAATDEAIRRYGNGGTNDAG